MDNLGFVPDGAAPPAASSPRTPAASSTRTSSGWVPSSSSRPPPTIFTTATAAAYTYRTDDLITANTLPRADMRNDDDTAALDEVRNRLQFLADTGYDLRHNLPS